MKFTSSLFIVCLRVGVLLIGALEQSLATVRHCCSILEGRISQAEFLKCEFTPDDAITKVHFASYGSSEQILQGDTCGAELTPDCGASVLSQVKTRCEGKRSCMLDTGDFSEPCWGKEKRLLLRWTCRSDSVSEAPLVQSMLPPLPLTVSSSFIMDNESKRFRIKGVNWAGGHMTRRVPTGLDHAPLGHLARLIAQLGFNLVRLTWSVQAVLEDSVVNGKVVAANPTLQGKSALAVMDAVVAALGQAGIVVWLDNHMSDADWCCSSDDCNGFWFNSRFGRKEWLQSIQNLARRYASVPHVIGIGLKNEPRDVCAGKAWGTGATCSLEFFKTSHGNYTNRNGQTCIKMMWNSGPDHMQYKAAMEEAGAIALQENPKLLVSVNGMDYATSLRDVRHAPVNLPRTNLVYEAHDYPFHYFSTTHWSHTFEQYVSSLDEQWGYLLHERIAPVWVSEFGMDGRAGTNDASWWSYFARYVQNDGPLADLGGLDWAFWQLSGVKSQGSSRKRGDLEQYGILNECSTSAQSWSSDGSNMEALKHIMTDPQASPASETSSVPKCHYALTLALLLRGLVLEAQ